MITPSGRCSVKNIFLEISQSSQENTCARVSFILKETLWHKCFPVDFAKFLRTPFPFRIEQLWWLLLFLVISKFSQQVFTYWEWNVFKITNKKTRRTSLTLFWCLYFKLWTYYTYCSSVSIVESEQVTAGWVMHLIT